jgi:DNA-directed RNA polymerase specialized sigma24 family protein
MLGLTTTVTTGKLPCGVFGEFYGKHYQAVYRAAKSVTRNFHDAQDIVQTVFARSLEQGPLSLDFLKNPEAYLCQAARNQARDLMRSRGRCTSRFHSLFSLCKF